MTDRATPDLPERFAAALRVVRARHTDGTVDFDTTVIIEAALWESANRAGVADAVSDLLAR